MKYFIILVFLVVAFSYSQLSFAQLQNSVGLSYDQCQKQILDQMNKTVSSIDKSKAISLAQSSPEFLAKVAGFKYTFLGITTNMTWNDSTCSDVKLKDVTIGFSVVNNSGLFEKDVQVDESPNLDQIIRVRDVYLKFCKGCPPAGPPPLDLQQTNQANSDIIHAKCLDGSQFLRQGIVDISQLGDNGKFYVNQESKIISSILNKDGKPKTVHLHLEITSPHPDIKVDQTKQVIFGNCEGRAIVQWNFIPQVPGKHQIRLKEVEGGSGYITNIEVRDPSGIITESYSGFSVVSDSNKIMSPEKSNSTIEFFNGKPFFVSKEYKITHNPNDIISFHGVKFTHPMFPDPPEPGGGAFTEITFQDNAKEILSHVGLLKNPVLLTKHINPQAGMRENQYDTFSILVSADLTKISSLQQLKSGVPIERIQCKEGFLLAIKPNNNNLACVRESTLEKLMKRGWKDAPVCHGCGVRSFDKPSYEGFDKASEVKILKDSADPEQKENYSPKNTLVVLGINNTVTWINDDDVPSSVTSDKEGLFSSVSIKPGGKWTHTFEKDGLYTYHSEPHPWMKGAIIVIPQNAESLSKPARQDIAWYILQQYFDNPITFLHMDNDVMIVGLPDDELKKNPNAESYYKEKFQHMIPFDMPIKIQFGKSWEFIDRKLCPNITEAFLVQIPPIGDPQRQVFFVKTNSTANLCIEYTSTLDNEGTFPMPMELFSNYYSNYTSNHDVRFIAEPDSVPLAYGSDTVVDYTIFTGNKIGTYWLPQSQMCDAIPIVVYSGEPQVNPSEIPVVVGIHSCPDHVLDAKIVGYGGGIMEDRHAKPLPGR